MRNFAVLLLMVPVLLGLSCQGGEDSVKAYIAILPSEKEEYVKLVKEFEEETGIKVEVVAQQYADIKRALEAEVSAGRGEADVVEVDVYYLSHVAPFVADLSDEAATLADRETISPELMQAGVFDGRTYFIPHRASWQALVYNSKYVEEPPDTWEELLAVAKEYPGKVGLKGALYEGLTCDILPFIWQAGGNPLDFEDPGSVRAMAFLAQLGPYLNPSSAVYREGTILEAQAKEEIYLHMNWPFVVAELEDKEMFPEPNRCAMLPRGPAGRATVLGGGYLAVSKVAPHREAAWKFIAFLAGARAQKYFAEHLGWFPIREEGWQGLPAEQEELYQGYADMAPFVKTRPTVPEYERISALWQQAFKEIVFEGQAVEDTMKKYATKAAELRGDSP